MNKLTAYLKKLPPAELLEECAKLLFGDRWQSALAEELGVSDRTMRRWVAGTSPIPDGVMGDVLYHMRLRLSDLEVTVEALDEMGIRED